MTILSSCPAQKKIAESNKTPFVWEGANVYFLMTDRFNNGDKSND
jgi:alpha-amylase